MLMNGVLPPDTWGRTPSHFLDFRGEILLDRILKLIAFGGNHLGQRHLAGGPGAAHTESDVRFSSPSSWPLTPSLLST
jgi:hypothetical protein